MQIVIENFNCFIKPPIITNFQNKEYRFSELTVRKFLKMTGGLYKTNGDILKEFCPDGIREDEIIQMALLKIINIKILGGKDKENTGNEKSSKKLTINYSYLIGKFMMYYPAYTYEMVLDLDLDIFTNLMEATKIINAEEQLRMLDVFENQLLLNSKKTAEKHKNLRGYLKKVSSKGLDVREHGISAIKQLFRGR